MGGAGIVFAATATALLAAAPDGAGLWTQLALALLLIAVGLVSRA
jgi:hypothetical protein